jgi:hypothetical protein
MNSYQSMSANTTYFHHYISNGLTSSQLTRLKLAGTELAATARANGGRLPAQDMNIHPKWAAFNAAIRSAESEYQISVTATGYPS